MILMIMGGQVFVSVANPVYRLYIFRKRVIKKAYGSDVQRFLLRSRDEDVRIRQIIQSSDDYQTLVRLVLVTILYAAIVNVVSIISCAIFFATSDTTRTVLEPAKIHPLWFSIFVVVAGFNNAGFTLLSSNMVPFKESPYMLLLMMGPMLLGNTAYPVALRFFIWLLAKVDKRSRPYYNKLLANPRLYFTHLFNRADTIWLLVRATPARLSFFFFVLRQP
jgi:Trk-type K+ transport system membrane component